MLSLFTSIKQRVCYRFHLLQERVLRWIKPAQGPRLPLISH
jgi:hypothetical protein